MEKLYEDVHVIVVVKPIGMPSQPDPTKDQDLYSTVLSQVKADKSFESLGLIQRLDRPVGGIMVLSKTGLAHKALTTQMHNHLISKKYLAVVEGEAKEYDYFKDYIQKVRGNRSIVTSKKVSQSKEAVLNYKLLKRHVRENQMYSLIEVELETGRHHQIRAQMTYHNLPLVGDTKYNASYKALDQWVFIGLYAYKVSFKHPLTNEKMSFETTITTTPFDMFD
jgi:23S rRNA pseudouridine1911/1915/1917 synthase